MTIAGLGSGGLSSFGGTPSAFGNEPGGVAGYSEGGDSVDLLGDADTSKPKDGATVLETHAETRAIEPRRVSGMPKLRRDLAEDFASGEPEQTRRVRKSPGVRITLPNGFPGSTVGRVAVGVLAAMMLGMFAVVLWGARHYLLSDPRLVLASSSSIQITGNHHLTRAQVLSVFGDQMERNVLSVSLADERQELEELPWVEHASVMRLLPDRLLIAITERTPVAFYRQGSHVGLVDPNGVLLDMRAEPLGSTPGDAVNLPQYSFPVVSGIAATDPLSVRIARMKMFGRFMTELRGSGDGIADRLSEVDLSSPEDVKALIPAGSRDILVHFGEDHFVDRYRRLEENLPKWIQDYPKLASADMRYERQVVLEMAAGTAVPVANSHATLDAGAAQPGVKARAHQAQSKGAPAIHAALPPHLHPREPHILPPTTSSNHPAQTGPQ